MKRIALFIVFCVSALTCGLGWSHQIATSKMLGTLPLTFTENQGASDSEVRFICKASDCSMLFTGSGVHIIPDNRTSAATVFQVEFPGLSENAVICGESLLSWKSNFFIGSDPGKWRTNVANYSSLRYKELYEGIDLVYYGDNGALKYDFIVKPAADHRRIRVRYKPEHATGTMSINDNGELVITTEHETIVEGKPYCYQIINGKTRECRADYIITDSSRMIFGFTIEDHDPAYDLIIDPTLSYSTFLGGTSDDSGKGIAVDSSGNVYVTGKATTGFPVHPDPGAYDTTLGGSSDVFIAKINADGSSLVYSTFVGGIHNDNGNAIAVDNAGQAYVIGDTFPDGGGLFPLVNEYQGFPGTFVWHAFVLKLNATGTALLYSSYLGGNFSTYTSALALDAAGNMYLGGNTAATNFPTKIAYDATANGGYDAFLSKFDPSLAGAASLVFSTYIGGSGDDWIGGIAVDAANNIYVTGSSDDAVTDWPTIGGSFDTTNNGNSDGIVAKFDPTGGSLVYSGFLGGTDDDWGIGISIDGAGKAYIAGRTESADFPMVSHYDNTRGGTGDAIVSIISADGSTIDYSTYLGGSDFVDFAQSIDVDGSGNIYVTGYTGSNDFPVSGDAYQGVYGGTYDVFVTKLDPSAGTSGLLYSTYFGGVLDDRGFFLTLDASGNNLYVTGKGRDGSPTTPGAYDTINNGLDDAFVLKLQFAAPPPPPMTGIPALNEWGIAAFFLMTILAMYILSKRRRTA